MRTPKPIPSKDRLALEKRRKAAARLFRANVPQAEIARRFGVTPAAVCQWHTAWKAEGIEGLDSKGPPGADPKLSEAARRVLKRAILAGPKEAGHDTDFWTLGRVRELIKKETRTTLGQTSVWRTMIDLGFSVQKPERRARERDERAISDWKLETFPRLKKMG